ncbi:MAG: aspartate-semialdehyde dehydrogenase [Candidatus Edwardsbacteria bacterium]
MKKYRVGVVGIGLVGQEILRVLLARKFPLAESIKILALHPREIELEDKTFEVKKATSQELDGLDFVFFAGTEGEKGASVTLAPEAIKRGAIVIDNGADFRLNPEVPLVVPEVNPEDLKWHKGLIANPNCSTIQLVVALAPIHRIARIRRIVVSTYQAVSGIGTKGIEELRSEAMERFAGSGNIKTEKFEKQLRIHKMCENLPALVLRILRQRPGCQSVVPYLEKKIFPQRIGFNLFPQIGEFSELGYSAEEWKMVKETQKILHDDSIHINATCVRVPVFNGHAESVYIETEKKLSLEEIYEILKNAPQVKLLREKYPTPIEVSGKDEVFIGRIRKDPFQDNAFSLWTVADNLRKGAATNAVQIAEKILEIQLSQTLELTKN